MFAGSLGQPPCVQVAPGEHLDYRVSPGFTFVAYTALERAKQSQR